MKKRMSVLIVVAIGALYFGGMTAFAAIEKGDSFCGNCGSALITHQEESARWNTTHQYFSGAYLDGKPIMIECTITHTVLQTTKYCPNRCYDSCSWGDESVRHNSSGCPYYNK